MNNEECLSLQNIPASLPVLRLLSPAQTGSCWAPGTGAVGRVGGGTGKHRGDWRETGAPLAMAFRCLFRKGGFLSGKTTQQLTHTVQIFVFFEAQYSYLTNVNSAPELCLLILFYILWLLNDSLKPEINTINFVGEKSFCSLLSSKKKFIKDHKSCLGLNLICRAEHLLLLG